MDLRMLDRLFLKLDEADVEPEVAEVPDVEDLGWIVTFMGGT